MAISNYTDLLAEVGAWLDRSDLSANIPTFISLAETSFKTDLRLRLMEVSVDIPLAIGQSEYSISSLLPRFQQMRALSVRKSGQHTALPYYNPETLDMLWGNSQNGQPRGYSLLGDNLIILPAPDSTWAVDARATFFEQPIPIGPSQATNALLTAYPNIYLFGTLLQAEPFLKDDSRIAIWADYYKQAVQRAMASDGRGTVEGSPIEDSGAY